MDGLAAVWRKKRLELLVLPKQVTSTEEDLQPSVGNKQELRPQRLDVVQLSEFLPKEMQALNFCYFFFQEKSKKPLRQENVRLSEEGLFTYIFIWKFKIEKQYLCTPYYF